MSAALPGREVMPGESDGLDLLDPLDRKASLGERVLPVPMDAGGSRAIRVPLGLTARRVVRDRRAFLVLLAQGAPKAPKARLVLRVTGSWT